MITSHSFLTHDADIIPREAVITLHANKKKAIDVEL